GTRSLLFLEVCGDYGISFTVSESGNLRAERLALSFGQRCVNIRLMGNFGKNEDCPPSQDLLAFQNGDIPLRESAGLRRHLAECEFCSAEVDFYEKYPQY